LCATLCLTLCVVIFPVPAFAVSNPSSTIEAREGSGYHAGRRQSLGLGLE
jgi:hypothetical protein